MYKVLWKPRVGETFIVVHETGKEHDRHAMAVYRDEEPGVIVGHLPQEIAKTCYYFTRHEGKISGEVAGSRVHSEEAGGLEVPCRLKLTSSSRNLRKLKEVFQQLNSPTVKIISSI